MQIIRTSRAQTVDTIRNDTIPDPTATPGVNPQDVQGFFGDGFFNQPAEDASSQPQGSFDLLFSGTPAAPGTGGPSTNDFASTHIPTVDEWLVQYPEGKPYLNLYRDKMQQILTNRFQARLDQTNQSLQNGGLSPDEIRTLQNLKEQLQQSIVTMQREIQKADTQYQAYQAACTRELTLMEDTDHNGYIGDMASDNYYIVAKYPGTGQEVILEKDGKTPVNIASNDPQYMPALASTDNLQLIDRSRLDALPLGVDAEHFDEAFELKNVDQWANGGFANSTFNAQNDISVPEGFWVRKGDDGKPKIITDSGTGERHFDPKPMETVTRDDGKPMLGQTSPATDEEKKKWIFVKTTDLEISSEKVDAQHDGGYVFYIFKDKDGTPIMRLRIQGVVTSGSNPLNTDGTNRVDATTVGIAVNSGLKADGKTATQHSTRVSPINIDASGFTSTGKVLPADIFDAASVRNFYEKLGIPSDNQNFITNYSDYQDLALNSRFGQSDSGSPWHDANYARRKKAANETIDGGFLDPLGFQATPSLGVYDPNYINQETLGHKNSDYVQTMANRFGIQIPADLSGDLTGHDNRIGNHLSTMGAYLPSDANDSNDYNSVKSGLACTGLRGSITGTKYNDIIVVPPPNDEALRKNLPPGVQAIDPESPAYGTYVDASGGKNIVVSKGGDLYAKGVTFLWRDSAGDNRDDKIFVQMNNGQNNNPADFVHIGDSRASVEIDNGDDIKADDVTKAKNDHPDDDPNKTLPAANDDYYDVPDNAEFTTAANDLPGGLDGSDESVRISTDDIKSAISTAGQKIVDEVIHKDPLSDASWANGIQWEYPPDVKKDMANGDAFFSEWGGFFDEQQQASTNLSLGNLQNGSHS